jgi:hypothetical protein
MQGLKGIFHHNMIFKMKGLSQLKLAIKIYSYLQRFFFFFFVGPGPREKKINSFILKLSCKINLDIKNITARKKAKKKKKKKKE